MHLKYIRFISVLYILAIIGLFFYSFTQIDLGLTWIKWPLGHMIELGFKQIGYFNRSFSTALYIFLLLLLFGTYVSFLFLANKNKLTPKTVWVLCVVTAGVLVFSYNTFSYDLFNYIFDAKIVTHYHANPYLHKALDYPHDPMLGFMHWTQRTYPYGPLWLLITIPLSFVGLKIFLPTFLLFKLLMAGSYVGSVYYIRKINTKINPKNEVFNMVLFGLNPLVIIECLVSAHNDIVMLFLSLLSMYLLLNKKIYRSILVLIMSIGIKFATVFISPVFLFVFYIFYKKKKIEWNFLISSVLALMFIPLVLVTQRTNFQSWYLLYLLPFAALITRKYYVVIPIGIVSFAALLLYTPFLYTGNWNPPIPMILNWIMISSIGVSLLIVGIVYIQRNGKLH